MFGDFYKFDDGDETNEEESSRVRRRVLSGNTSICRTHKILSKENLSCNGWNNTGIYFIQIILLLILMAIIKALGNWARA